MSVYLRYELLRTFRNRRFFVFSLFFPLVLYFVIAGPNRDETDFLGTGVSAPLYYMVSLASFGTMMATVGCGARIAAERELNWNRQLRVTPLGARTYIGAKVVTAYALAVVSIVAMYLCGTVLGVRLPLGEWVAMTGLLLVGLVPFAAIGILIGHLVRSDTIGPVMGGGTSILALLGGTWFPITSGVMLTVAKLLPSYWLVQAARVPIGGEAWGWLGWAVVAAWSAIFAALAAWAYRRDTARA